MLFKQAHVEGMGDEGIMKPAAEIRRKIASCNMQAIADEILVWFGKRLAFDAYLRNQRIPCSLGWVRGYKKVDINWVAGHLVGHIDMTLRVQLPWHRLIGPLIKLGSECLLKECNIRQITMRNNSLNHLHEFNAGQC